MKPSSEQNPKSPEEHTSVVWHDVIWPLDEARESGRKHASWTKGGSHSYALAVTGLPYGRSRFRDGQLKIAIELRPQIASTRAMTKTLLSFRKTPALRNCCILKKMVTPGSPVPPWLICNTSRFWNMAMPDLSLATQP